MTGNTPLKLISMSEINAEEVQWLWYRGLGSIDCRASARSVLIVGRLKSGDTLRIVAQDKNSLAPEGSSIAFELHPECESIVEPQEEGGESEGGEDVEEQTGAGTDVRSRLDVRFGLQPVEKDLDRLPDAADVRGRGVLGHQSVVFLPLTRRNERDVSLGLQVRHQGAVAATQVEHVRALGHELRDGVLNLWVAHACTSAILSK